MVLVKNMKFFHVFIFGKISQQNVFDVILESRKVLLDYKTQKVKKAEKSGFFQRVFHKYVHGFGQKFEIFSMFLFLAQSASKMC